MTGPTRGRGRRAASTSRASAARTKDTGRRTASSREGRGTRGAERERATTGRRRAVGRDKRGGNPTLLLAGGGGAILIVVVLLAVVMSRGGGSDEPESPAAETTSLPAGPTEREMGEARGLYRDAQELAERADALTADGEKARADAARRDAKAKLERALGIWQAAMERTPEEKRKNYVKYEDDEVRHWNLLLRQVMRP